MRPSPCCSRRAGEQGSTGCGTLAAPCASGRRPSRTSWERVRQVGARLAERLGLGSGVRDGLYQSFERWDGKGAPTAWPPTGICLPARWARSATRPSFLDRHGGPESAVAVIRRRAGGWFDPALADAFARMLGPSSMGSTPQDVWEPCWRPSPSPAPDRQAGPGRPGAVLRRLGRPQVALHCSVTPAGWPPWRSGAARALGLPGSESSTCGGRRCCTTSAASASRTRSGRGPARSARSEWEQVRLHPYHTERILARSRTWRRWPRSRGCTTSGSTAPATTAGSGAARPGRRPDPRRGRRLPGHDPGPPPPPGADSPRPPQQSLPRRRGGPPRPRRASAPCSRPPGRPARRSGPHGRPGSATARSRCCGWSPAGSRNRADRQAAVISPATAEHHVQHIYTKIGVSTRAAAALFAIEHGLLRIG